MLCLLDPQRDCAGDVIMGLVREPSYFRGFPQALSRVHVHVFAEW